MGFASLNPSYGFSNSGHGVDGPDKPGHGTHAGTGKFFGCCTLAAHWNSDSTSSSVCVPLRIVPTTIPCVFPDAVIPHGSMYRNNFTILASIAPFMTLS